MKPFSNRSTRRALAGAFLAGFLVPAHAVMAQTVPDIAEQERVPWVTSAAAGLTLTRGDSDTLMFTSNIQSSKRWEQNEARLGASGTYGETDNERSAETISAFAQYNRLFSEQMYGYLRIDGLRDAVANVEYRFALSPGLGYYFIKRADTFLSVEVGPGLIHEKQGGTTDTYATLRIAQRFEHKLSDRSRIWQYAEILPQVDDFENYLFNAEIGIESGLTEKLSLRNFITNTYDNEPAPGRKKNNMKLVSALAYTF